MLPPPTLSFTLPSVDDHVLQCRIYHPTCLAPNTIAEISDWRKRGAIVAHPYAPLGGSYDDPVVDVVASTILKEGYIVGTFNFRGAGGKGRTSWSSKPEQNDYLSFIAFMIYYLHHIQAPAPPLYHLRSPAFMRSDPELHDLSRTKLQAISPSRVFETRFLNRNGSNTISPFDPELDRRSNTKPRLLLAGYSYGAMVTCSLPPMISSIIAPFQTPLPGSPYAETRLRANNLASQQNALMKARMHSLVSQSRGRTPKIEDHILHSPKLRSANMRMGGEEDLRRASHDSYRPRNSFTIDIPERVRKSIDRIRSLGKRNSPRRAESRGSVASSKKGSGSSSENIAAHDGVNEKYMIKAIPGVADELQVAYLLVSPLQGMINNLASMWSSRFGRRRDVDPEHDLKLTIDPTLALFGDDDVFVSVKKLRAWVEKLVGAERQGKECQFRHKEVAGAGHFWHNHASMQTLREEVKEFIDTL